MSMPLEITFHGIPGSPALRDAVTEYAAKLERLAPDIVSCHVTIEHENGRHRQGNTYRVHAHLNVPGGEIDAGRSPRAGAAYPDPYVAMRDTFSTLRRRLEEHRQRLRGEIKRHESGPRRGRILELYPDSGYGVIQTEDGRKVQFHRASLARGDSDLLEVGHEVRFVEVPGNNGPWAGNVHPSGEEQAKAG